MMKKMVVLGLILALCLCLLPSAMAEDALFPIIENGLWGYMNASGEVVIAPQYAWAGEFRGAGYAAVEAVSTQDDMYATGIIDRTGKFVVEPKYASDEGYDGFYYGGKDTGVIWLMEETNGFVGFFDVASGCFSGAVFESAPLHVSDEKLLAVSKGELIGFADRTTGKLVIDYQFLDSSDWTFTNGYAYVEKQGSNDDYLPMMIDEKGKEIKLPDGIFPVEYACVENGLFAVLEEDTNLYGFADVSGKIAIQPIYDEVMDFDNGFADVTLEGEPIVIDTTGNRAVRPETAEEKTATVEFTGDSDLCTASVIGADGTVLIPYEAGYLFDISYEYGFEDFFAEGLQVLVKDNRYGFVDETGAIAIPFEYDVAVNFENGLAYAEKDGVRMYIDHAGKVIWQEK